MSAASGTESAKAESAGRAGFVYSDLNVCPAVILAEAGFAASYCPGDRVWMRLVEDQLEAAVVTTTGRERVEVRYRPVRRLGPPGRLVHRWVDAGGLAPRDKAHFGRLQLR